MSLQGFQQALCDLVASPALCFDLRHGQGAILDRYELSEREHRRLMSMVCQRGMSTNCSLYRSNRITPLYTLLHHTCVLLGEALSREVDLYWKSGEFLDLQFAEEIERFAEFLRRRIAGGALTNALLPEILEFEVATNVLRFAPRRRLLDAAARTLTSRTGPPALHPLVRVVRFTHEPSALLGLLGDGRQPPYLLPSGEFHVLLDHRGATLQVADLEPEAGRLLLDVQSGVAELDETALAPFIEAGLVLGAGIMWPLAEPDRELASQIGEAAAAVGV